MGAGHVMTAFLSCPGLSGASRSFGSVYIIPDHPGPADDRILNIYCSPLLLLQNGYVEDKCAAAVFALTFNPDCSAVHLHKALYQREPQTGALVHPAV